MNKTVTVAEWCESCWAGATSEHSLIFNEEPEALLATKTLEGPVRPPRGSASDAPAFTLLTFKRLDGKSCSHEIICLIWRLLDKHLQTSYSVPLVSTDTSYMLTGHRRAPVGDFWHSQHHNILAYHTCDDVKPCKCRFALNKGLLVFASTFFGSKLLLHIKFSLIHPCRKCIVQRFRGWKSLFMTLSL